MEEKKGKNNKLSMKTILLISTIFVLFIPMLYSTIYLGAFWDPYDNLENVSVAFVNLDKAITKDNKTYEIGNELEKNLRNNKKLDWKFVNKEEANRGLRETDYYAVVTIPEDFSKKISNASEGKVDSSDIIYSANKGKNFIFSQLSQKATENIKAEVSENIQKEISKALVENMYTIKDSIKEAEDGVSELQEGATKLSEGSKKLSDGTSNASEGSNKLEDGLKTANNGSNDLKNGIDKLSNGGLALSKGVDSAREGSQKLTSGLNDLSKGEEKVAKGSSELARGLESLKDNLTQSNDSITVLVRGTQSLSESTSKLTRGVQQLDNSLSSGLNNAANGVKASTDNIENVSKTLKTQIQNIDNSDMSNEDKEILKGSIISLEKINQANKNSNIEGSLREASNAVKPIAENMQKLETETKKVSGGVSLLATSLEQTQVKAKDGVDKLIGGAREIENGSQSLLNGLNMASAKTGELTKGLNKVYDGTNELSTGLLSAKDGASNLNQGLETAYLKTGELSDGLNSIRIGAFSLSDGLNALEEGNNELKTGLNDGYEELDDKLKFSSDEMSDFISNPVKIKEEVVNDVNHYGEGLAPYFVSLSLWLGALFINLIISLNDKFKLIEKSYLNGFVRKFSLGMVLVSIQAVILSLSLILVLKIELVSILGFYLSNIFISIVFFSLMYGVSYAIGLVGTPIMFIFFLLQISSAGGTFPIETSPAFYKAINSFIPMTYAVDVLRMVISGINSMVFKYNLMILLVFMISFLLGGFIINKIKEKQKIAEI